jgi:CRP-like cAMP-binding protein
LLLNAVILAMQSISKEADDVIIQKGDTTEEMYFICRGEVQVFDEKDEVVSELKEGNFFGEIGLLMSTERTATVKAKTSCDLFTLSKSVFGRILRDHPQFADNIMRIAKERYDLSVSMTDLIE